MFEKFTQRARTVLVFAQDEARDLNHGYIGSEHMLLGLLHLDEGMSVLVFRSLGVNTSQVREQVVRIVGRGEAPIQGQIPFTARAKRMLELSLRESIALGQNHIGAEHLILSLARIKDGVAIRALAELGVDAELLRSAVLDQLKVTGQQFDPAEHGDVFFTSPPLAPELVSELERLHSEMQQAVEAGGPTAGRLRDPERMLLQAAIALMRAWQQYMNDRSR